MSTNRVKWDDTNNRLTAYCSDDTGETELGPVKWDDTNNKLELNCDSTDYQVKWNDTDNELEAQSVGDGCCCDKPTGQVDVDILCPECDVEISFADINDCPDPDCVLSGTNGNSYILTNIASKHWQYLSEGSLKIELKQQLPGFTNWLIMYCWVVTGEDSGYWWAGFGDHWNGYSSGGDNELGEACYQHTSWGGTWSLEDVSC